jgi:hypothetical protein
LLSPSNKEEPGRSQYLTKRLAVIYQQVHLVELDLLLGGQRLPMARPLPKADYYYLVSRSERRPDSDVFSWKLRDRLPTLPIPLRAPDLDIQLDLGAVFATAYARGRFYRRINYQGPLPKVSSQDEEWVKNFAQSRG